MQFPVETKQKRLKRRLEDFSKQEAKREKKKARKILKPLLAKTGEKETLGCCLFFQMSLEMFH
jgi:hypothetical protein